MTNCYNCGHTGTFVLLVQCALAVPGTDTPDANRSDSDALVANPNDSEASGDRRPARPGDRKADDRKADGGKADDETAPCSGGPSFAVQCPACDSTDVGVAAEDLLARYRSRITS